MSDPLHVPAGRDELLSDLNPPQREAVTAPRGPLLVIAGAGTGKTRVLTRRVAWKVMREGVAPRSVLAITFTNKAADVLKERLGSLPGGGAVTAGTFHGFCALLLRRFADRIGGSKDFTILDQEDQTRLLKDLLEDFKIDATAYRPQAFSAAISYRKNGGAGRMPDAFADGRFLEHLERVERRYLERLRVSGLYDFDDLLLEAARLLEDVPEATEASRERWRTVLVDEYQDTNGVQSRLLAALVGGDPDLTVVGDPDQSIYRWRGASIRNILRFREAYPGARLVKLEENYRSTKHVLAAAEAVIAGNTERYDKRLFTSNPTGDRLVELACRDAVDESAAVVRLLSAWRETGMPWSEMAVFFRVNHLSRGVETALRNAGIPYDLVSGVEFFQRREVKDVLAYARLLENPHDEAAFARVVNAPRRGVGESSLARVRAHATAHGISVPEAAAAKVEGVSGKARAGLDRLLAALAALRLRPRSPVGPLLEAVADETGYRADLLGREDDLERSRVANVDELVGAARELDKAEPGLTLRDFLERVALASEQDGLDDASGKVSLMTVHAAKGLEFDGVVVLAAEEGSFPHARSADRPEEVEEERRLFYVALTRARKRLAWTHVVQREGWRGVERRQPSRFLSVVPAASVEVVDRTGYHVPLRARVEPPPRRFAPPAEDAAAADDASVADASSHDTVRASVEDVVPRPGERVAHPYFGEGRMVSSAGAGASLRVTVEFDGVGTKTILWSFARLARVGASPGGAP